MGRVCLILPVASAFALSAEWVARCRGGLERAGHAVRVIAVLEGDGPRPSDAADNDWEWLISGSRGLSAAAMTGLREAEDLAETLIVLAPDQNYHPDDLARLIEPLMQGRAEIAVARREGSGVDARGRGLVAAAVGRVARPLVGASDLFAGLVAISASQAGEVSRAFNPIGSRFTVDLLFRSRGRRVEVPIRVEGPSTPVPMHLDDLRHIKRLADDRFGNASRLIQFCAVGASGMVVDLSSYAIFQLIFSKTWLASRTAPLVGGPLDLAAAGALAIALALTWNFSLNRRLTFSYARDGSLVRQFMTYALSNALGIALSFSLRLYLPVHIGFFHSHRLAAAVVGIVTATGISFSMSRWLVFRNRTPSTPHPHAPERCADVVVEGRRADHVGPLTERTLTIPQKQHEPAACHAPASVRSFVRSKAIHGGRGEPPCQEAC